MVARVGRMMSGFLLPLVVGTLLLSAAVVLADPTYPANPAGTARTHHRCDRQCGPPGADGNCTYPLNTCMAVGADLAGGALGEPFFKTTHYR